MKFTMPKFLISLCITVVLGGVAVVALRAFGVIGKPGPNPDDPAELVRQATNNLDAVRRRQPGERRPASYDSVLGPLDKLLAQAKALLESESYNPVNDFEKIRSLTAPVIDIATQADAQARTETGFLAKEFRFNAQKGEACQYLANAMWERMRRRMPERAGYFSGGAAYPAGEMADLRRVLDTGLAVASQSAELHYIRGIVNHAEGVFGSAARDLEKATDLDKGYAAAWNALGVVRISLKEFEKAEEALNRARAAALDASEKSGRPTGEEYVAIVYNLASFHDNLAAHYIRENRITPTVESQRLATRHAAEARRYYGELLKLEPPGSAGAKEASSRLEMLPR